MQSEEKTIILRVVENYLHTGNLSDDQVKVTGLPKGKTIYIETIGEDGRSIMLDEFHVDSKTVWAGYSRRCGTVYLSLENN